MDELCLEIAEHYSSEVKPENNEEEDECEFLIKDYLAEWREIVNV